MSGGSKLHEISGMSGGCGGNNGVLAALSQTVTATQAMSGGSRVIINPLFATSTASKTSDAPINDSTALVSTLYPSYRSTGTGPPSLHHFYRGGQFWSGWHSSWCSALSLVAALAASRLSEGTSAFAPRHPFPNSMYVCTGLCLF